ncbi:MAG: hypothetical protein GPJ51_03030 [Candidatus Heimdallarchaeota archaeon]|nr:hypothetical protein [Candidatus Heimdallarchaeota archaeon]
MDSISDTNRLSQDFLTLDQNFTLYVTDYFNVTLTYFNVTLNYTLTTNYVDVEILLYQAQFTNRYNFAVTLEIVRNYHSHSFVLIANQTIAFWLTAGNYTVTASPLVNAEYDSYSQSWTTTSEIKHYRIYLDPKPTTTKKPINIVAFVVGIVQAGAIAGGLTFAYMNIYKPLKNEFFGFSIKNAFKHKKKQTWTTILIAIVAIAMGSLYTLGS